MAHEKSCSGTQVIPLWTTALGTCVYQLTLFIDGVPITNTVPVDNTMSDAQIAALLNANRTGNTTGTFTVQTIGTDLNITLTGIVLSSTALGVYSLTIIGTGFPCPAFSRTPVVLTCNIIPDPKNKKRRIGALSMQRCPDEIIFKADTSPERVSYCNQIYYFYTTDENGLLHYIKSSSNISFRGTGNWWIKYI